MKEWINVWIEKNYPRLIVIAVALIFGGYLWYDFTHPYEPNTPEEKDQYYSDTGPQGASNRFGQ